MIALAQLTPRCGRQACVRGRRARAAGRHRQGLESWISRPNKAHRFCDNSGWPRGTGGIRAPRGAAVPPFRDRFLALQNRAELFPAQFFERISTHRAEGGVNPLHQAVRAGHYQTIRGNLLRAIAEQSQNSGLESRRRSKVAWTQRSERDGGANFGQFDDALPEFIVEFEHQFKLLPFLRQHGARYVEHSSFLKKFVNHWEIEIQKLNTTKILRLDASSGYWSGAVFFTGAASRGLMAARALPLQAESPSSECASGGFLRAGRLLHRRSMRGISPCAWTPSNGSNCQAHSACRNTPTAA